MNAIQEELQNAAAGLDAQVKSAIHKFKLRRSALNEAIDISEELIQIKAAHELIQRRQAVLTLVRTTTRDFDVDNAIFDIVVCV